MIHLKKEKGCCSLETTFQALVTKQEWPESLQPAIMLISFPRAWPGRYAHLRLARAPEYNLTDRQFLDRNAAGETCRYRNREGRSRVGAQIAARILMSEWVVKGYTHGYTKETFRKKEQAK